MTSSAIPASAYEAATWLQVGPEVALGPDLGSAGLEAQQTPARVLVVEDDYFVAMEIETTLADMRCNIVGTAATGEEAIEIAERERPDLVLMDIRLAGALDGIEAAALIHARFGIRSLFVTAHSDPVTHSRGAIANPIGWASKPFSPHQLSNSIRDALKALGAEPGE